MLNITEGIIPALESAHALAYAKKLAPAMDKDPIIIVNLSGRDDKDVEQVFPSIPHAEKITKSKGLPSIYQIHRSSSLVEIAAVCLNVIARPSNGFSSQDGSGFLCMYVCSGQRNIQALSCDFDTFVLSII